MKTNLLIKIPLWVLVLIGFLGALNVSYFNATTNNVCPHIAIIPVCYVVLAAFSMMLLSLIINQYGCKQHLFIAGWGIAFLIALLGSGMEVMKGNVCPATASGLPLCFVSLALCIAIFILFFIGSCKQACEISKKK